MRYCRQKLCTKALTTKQMNKRKMKMRGQELWICCCTKLARIDYSYSIPAEELEGLFLRGEGSIQTLDRESVQGLEKGGEYK